MIGTVQSKTATASPVGATFPEPLGDRVVVSLSEVSDRTESGIIIAEAAKEKPSQGVVQAVGPGRVTDTGETIPVALSVGDEVVFSKYGGTEISANGADYLILRESDILARLVPVQGYRAPHPKADA